MLQDLLGQAWKPLGRTSWLPSVLLSSTLVVGAWGWFLYQGVRDPLGGINTLWPLFGIANQLLAAVALCVGTTIIIKMGKAKYAPITMAPLVWLAIITMTAGYQKIFSPDPRLGFLARANLYETTLAAGNLPPGIASAEVAQRFILNDRIDTAVTAFFMVSVIIIITASVREWYKVVSGRMPAVSSEHPFEPRPAVAGD
jgi:carbon starvation protein